MCDSYQHILNVAFELISARPLSQIKASDIIKASKVSKGTFYRYFKDKYDCISTSYVEVFLKPFDDRNLSFFKAFNVHAEEILKSKQTLKNIAQNDNFLLAFSDINDGYRRYFMKILVEKDPTLIDDLTCIKAINYFCRTCAVTLYLYGNDKISNDEILFFVENIEDVVPSRLKEVFK